MEWMAHIVAAGLCMVLPGLAGNWVDQQIGTHFTALIGFAFGIARSLVYLLAITRSTTSTTQATMQPKKGQSEETSGLTKSGAFRQEPLAWNKQ